MSRTLVVTEGVRSTGEFRRRWVRWIYARYVRVYKRTFTAAVEKLSADADVTVLGSRRLMDPERLRNRVSVRFYDEEWYRPNSEALADLTHELIADWWPPRDEEPALCVRGVWLPDLLWVTRGILLRLEVIEALGAIEAVLNDVRPDRVVLPTGASTAERLARRVAIDGGMTVTVARGVWLPRVMALPRPWVHRWLRWREDRQVLRLLMTQPRRSGAGQQRTRVLLSVCHARHLEMVRPISLALAREGIATSIVAGTVKPDALGSRLRAFEGAEGIPWSFFMDHVNPAEARQLVREMRPVLCRLQRRQAEKGVAVPGRGALADIVAPYAKDAIWYGLPMARLYVEAAFRVLERVRPEVVIVQSDRRLAEQALALAARALGIPTMLFWGSSLRAHDRTNQFDIGDRTLAIGEHVRAGLVEQGVDPRNLVVVGDPRSNAARLVDRATLRTDVARAFGLSPERPLLVMISKYVSVVFSVEEKEAFYRTVHDAVVKLEGAQVVVKVHPNEDLRLLEQQVTEWGWPDAKLTQDYDIHRLFGAADAAIMVTSMAGTEAMAMGCPVIAVQTAGRDFEGGDYMPPYVTEGVVERVDLGDAGGLARVLARLLTDTGAREELIERGRKFAARYLHPVDGKLADRLLAVADEIRAELAEAPRA